jgi:hypothetical protein
MRQSQVTWIIDLVCKTDSDSDCDPDSDPDLTPQHQGLRVPCDPRRLNAEVFRFWAGFACQLLPGKISSHAPE